MKLLKVKAYIDFEIPTLNSAFSGKLWTPEKQIPQLTGIGQGGAMKRWFSVVLDADSSCHSDIVLAPFGTEFCIGIEMEGWASMAYRGSLAETSITCSADEIHIERIGDPPIVERGPSVPHLGVSYHVREAVTLPVLEP